MQYFRVLIGLRGCYSDSSENDVHAFENAAELRKLINERADWHTDTLEDEESKFDPCTEDNAESLWRVYTSANAPYLPTCAVTWGGGAWGVLVSGATESEYAETQVSESDDFTAASGNVYFWAPSMLVPFIEYGAESGEPEKECAAYLKQAMQAHDIPETAAHKIINVSFENGESSFKQLPAFTMPTGHDYAGPAHVICYVPGLPG